MMKYLKNTILAGTIILGSFIGSGNSYANENHNRVVTVQKGDSIYKIAKNSINNTSLEEVLVKSEEIASINGFESIEENPWHKNYVCSETTDPNCIYPGQKLKLEQDPVPSYTASVPAESSKKNNSDFFLKAFLGLCFVTGAASVYTIANDYMREKRLDKHRKTVWNIDSLIEDFGYKKYRKMQRRGELEGMIAKYDNKLAPEEMKNELIDLYQTSEKNLNTISESLSKKYAMNISSSTISKYARQALKVSNRREARNNGTIKKVHKEQNS